MEWDTELLADRPCGLQLALGGVATHQTARQLVVLLVMHLPVSSSALFRGGLFCCAYIKSHLH